VENLDFLLNCILNFAFVFLVLSVLSLSIRLLVAVFPEKSNDENDSALMTAITNHYNKSYPHLRITKIEEQK